MPPKAITKEDTMKKFYKSDVISAALLALAITLAVHCIFGVISAASLPLDQFCSEYGSGFDSAAECETWIDD
jgi:hypothetical protein